MIHQTTIGKRVSLSGAGLHTGCGCTATLHPAGAGHGRQLVAANRSGASVPISSKNWTPSRMSTSIAMGDRRTIRTIEHLMAALTAYSVDNVLIEVDGPEIPIFDGSAARWCRVLRGAGVASLDVARRAICIRKPVQVARDGGFLRAEPAPRFEVDVTHDVLPDFPIMRWHGAIDAQGFERELARARSFGMLRRRLGLAPKLAARPRTDSAVEPNKTDPATKIAEEPWDDIAARQAAIGNEGPLLRGWRPWRATLIVGDRVLPWPRFPNEPARHVTLDMIGDLALAGEPLIGRVVAHNPSHDKTFALVSALMNATDSWELVTLDTMETAAA